MKSRPATRQEILSTYSGRRVSFGTYVREIYAPRAKNGVAHICKATALVRNVNGVPTVRRLGEDFELFAKVYTLNSTGREFTATPTIVRRAAR